MFRWMARSLEGRCGRSWMSQAVVGSGLVVVLLLGLAHPAARAQEWRGKSHDLEQKGLDPVLRPYVFGAFGFGDPMDVSYGQAFDDPYVRIGGGFGMRYHGFGAEVMIRGGSVEQTHIFNASSDNPTVRTFYLATTELQMRLYGAPRVGDFRFPAGISFGLVNMTVDRGFPGIFDRFKGSGTFVGPFVGAEYKVIKSLTVGVDMEYAVSSTHFTDHPGWEDQYGTNLPGIPQATESNFWDTVGGSRTHDFDTGGLMVSVRAIIFIPTFQPGK